MQYIKSNAALTLALGIRSLISCYPTVLTFGLIPVRLSVAINFFGQFNCNKFSAPESVPDVDAKLKAPNTADEKFEDMVKSAQDAAVLVLVY